MLLNFSKQTKIGVASMHNKFHVIASFHGDTQHLRLVVTNRHCHYFTGDVYHLPTCHCVVAIHSWPLHRVTGGANVQQQQQHLPLLLF